MSSFAENKRRFRSQPTINPETDRSIKVNSKTYNLLVDKYGLPTKRSPAKRSPTKKSPVKRSPFKRSPSRLAGSRSPVNKESVDMFAVLSPESIRNVFNKLSNEHKQAFLDSSAHVRRVLGY